MDFTATPRCVEMTSGPSTSFSMKVFWPTKGLQAQAGQLVGWAIGDTIVVVGVVGEVSVE